MIASSFAPLYQLCRHKLTLLPLLGILFQEVREEEHLQHHEDNEQLDENDQP